MKPIVSLLVVSLLVSAAVAGDDAKKKCDYAEDFTEAPKDWSCGPYSLKWQDKDPGYRHDKINGHKAKGSLFVTDGSSNPTRFWYHFGDDKPDSIHIEFWYFQFKPDKDFSVEFKFSEKDECDFPTKDYQELKKLAEEGLDWIKEDKCDIPVPKGMRAVYVQFRRHTPSKAGLHIDDLTITAVKGK